jgi:hypothetical protein
MMAWMPTYFHEVFPDQARNVSEITIDNDVDDEVSLGLDV